MILTPKRPDLDLGPPFHALTAIEERLDQYRIGAKGFSYIPQEYPRVFRSEWKRDASRCQRSRLLPGRLSWSGTPR